jgi:hypothetical protein
VRYLGSVHPSRVGMLACVDQSVPALQPGTGLWSAFVAPDLAAIFSAEPWLDLAPSPDAQAHVLSRLESIKPAAFQAALSLSPVTPPATPSATPPNGLTPRQAVMNDQAVELHLRIDAAKALLPYFEGNVR